MKQILRIAIPNGMENGIFQLVKVALSSMAALFGTYQIAANGVAQSIWSLAALAGVAMGPVFITVIGQCMGNGDTEAADEYFKKLTRITLLLSSAWNLLIFLLTPLFLRFYALELETKRLVILLVLIHNLFNAAAYPFSGALSNGLRAARRCEIYHVCFGFLHDRGASAAVLGLRNGPAYGRDRDCRRDGLRLGSAGGRILLEAEVRQVEELSGDIICTREKGCEWYGFKNKSLNAYRSRMEKPLFLCCSFIAWEHFSTAL